MAISDWFKKFKTGDEPLRRPDQMQTEEINISEEFSDIIHCGAKHIVINKDFILRETLTIDVDGLLIDGKGITIEARNMDSPMFVIESNNITLKNITFKNGYSTKGGGVIHNTNGTLNLIKCDFYGNKAIKNNGGAIHNLNGRINIRDCRFESNQSDGRDGGAIYNLDGELNIDGCSFKGNSSYFGGAIYNGKTLNIKNTKFKDNHSGKGLSIFNTNDATLSECTFEKTNEPENTPEIHNSGIINIEKSEKEKLENITHGGFIHIKSENTKQFKFLDSIIASGEKEITLNYDFINKEYIKGIDINEDDITIDGNHNIIDGLGKGIFNINASNVTLKNISFRNGSNFKGGAINNRSDSLNLVNCSFDFNISNAGGAINNEGTIKLENCRFNKNIANEANGGAIDNNGKLTLIDCKFKNNSCEMSGGAINNMDTAKVNDCTFESNHAKENGASINNGEKASLIMNGSTFKKNAADKKGTAIYNNNHVEMKKCDFENNISTPESNIIFQRGDENSRLDINDCTFSRDKFSNNLIFIENGSCDVDSSTFKLKKDRENSYAIYNDNGVLKIRGVEFENIESEAIFNNNEIHFERNMEPYIKPGDEGLPFNYL